MIEVDLGRGQGSHVTRQGIAKVAFGTREEADREAAHLRSARRAPYFPYLCGQRPEHYHLSASITDLQPENYVPRYAPDAWLAPGERRGWYCVDCGAWGVGKPHHDRCPDCRSSEVARAGISECPTGGDARRCGNPLHRRNRVQTAHVRDRT